MWRGRAGRGCAAGSSGGAIRRQPKNVFNVNFPGRLNVAATYAANATQLGVCLANSTQYAMLSSETPRRPSGLGLHR